MMTHMSMSLIMMTMRTLSESFYSFTTIIRVSSHSYIPDLETQQQQMHLHQQTSGPGFESSRIYQHHQPSPPNHLSESVLEPAPPTSLVIKTALIEPHPQVVAKKKEVLHDLAVQKHAVQEAKGFFLLELVLEE